MLQECHGCTLTHPHPHPLLKGVTLSTILMQMTSKTKRRPKVKMIFTKSDKSYLTLCSSQRSISKNAFACVQFLRGCPIKFSSQECVKSMNALVSSFREQKQPKKQKKNMEGVLLLSAPTTPLLKSMNALVLSFRVGFRCSSDLLPGDSFKLMTLP